MALSYPAWVLGLLVGPFFGSTGGWTYAMVDARFEPLAQTQLSPALKQASQATVKIWSLTERQSYGSCSAVMLSEDGYVLTAGQCVMDLMTISSLSTAEGASLATRSGSAALGYSQNVVDHEALATKRLELKKEKKPLVLDDVWMPEYAVYSAELVAVGKGYFKPNDLMASRFTPETIEDARANQENYAILKFDLEKKAACLPVPATTLSLSVGMDLQQLGYPGEVTRDGGLGSNGKSQYRSQGKLISGLAGNAYYSEKGLSPEDIQTLEAIYLAPGVFVTSSDSYAGSLGGPILDAQGQLVGIALPPAVADVRELRDRAYMGSSLGLSLAAIRASVEAQIGAERARKVFSCRAR